MQPLIREDDSPAERSSEERRTEGSFGTGRLKQQNGRQCNKHTMQQAYHAASNAYSIRKQVSKCPRFIPVNGYPSEK